MADNQYLVGGGFIQRFKDKDSGEFKPAVETRDVNGQKVRSFTLKMLGSQKLVRVSVWPEFAAVEIPERAFVVVDGKFTQSQGNNGTTYYNLDAKDIVVFPSATPAAREVVNQPSAATEDTDKAPF